jgi:hypothetical protein
MLPRQPLRAAASFDAAYIDAAFRQLLLLLPL